MKDVAILTKFYKNYNYGGMLQGYALQRVISDLGYTADIVSYDVKKNANSVYPSIIVQAKQYGAKAAAAKVGEKAIGKGKVFIKDIISDRTEKFTQFMTDTDAGTEVYSDDTMYLLTSRYKTFVSGSDQVWNPNAVRNLYLQTFSAVSGRKISYAASIGRDELSEFEANAMIPSLRQFGSISVRENTAKALLEKYIDTPITTVLDPTMLLSADDWAEIAAERAVKGRYAVVYFFSDSLKVRRESEAFCKKHGLELIMIPYAKQEYNLTDKKGPGIRSDRVGPNEFVSLIRNADFVITDSFHGAVFSLIHRIPFAVFERNKAGHVSMNSRLYDLLDTFDESRRLIDVSRIDELDGLIEIDKEKIRRVMEERKAESLSFLKNAIEKGIAAYEREEALVTVTGRESSCSGCGACAELCPRKCITIRPNDNGFNVPVIHTDQCIRCGKCRRVCPMLGNYQGSESIKAYGAYAKKEEPKSASGGLSYLISSEFIRSGGAVYGASYADDLRVRIERAACIDQLASFQGSKYVQADMGDSLSKAANDLRAECKLTVCKEAKSLKLTKTVGTLGVGEGCYIKAVLPEGTAAFKKTFTSSKTTVATVDSTGLVIAATTLSVRSRSTCRGVRIPKTACRGRSRPNLSTRATRGSIPPTRTSRRPPRGTRRRLRGWTTPSATSYATLSGTESPATRSSCSRRTTVLPTNTARTPGRLARRDRSTG